MDAMRRLSLAGFTSLESISALVAAAVLALFVGWAVADGGYEQTTWLPSGLLIVGLLAFVAATGAGLPTPPFGLIAFASLAAFTVWNALTILWADDRAIAWTGTNRTLVY